VRWLGGLEAAVDKRGKRRIVRPKKDLGGCCWRTRRKREGEESGWRRRGTSFWNGGAGLGESECGQDGERGRSDGRTGGKAGWRRRWTETFCTAWTW
jgi:hypothetical protein